MAILTEEQLRKLAFEVDSELGLMDNRISILVDAEIELGQLVDKMYEASYRGEEKIYYDEHFRKLRLLSEVVRYALDHLTTNFDKAEKAHSVLMYQVYARVENSERIVENAKWGYWN